jgi:hypothetical protein
MKSFKYFDLNNNGSVEPDEFAKAIEKIGIQIPTQKVSNSLQFLRYVLFDDLRTIQKSLREVPSSKIYLLNYMS